MTEVISIHCGPSQAEALANLIGHVEAGSLTLIDLGANAKAFPVEIFDGEAMTLHTIIAAFNGSLDAAKALQEALLPNNWGYNLEWREDWFVSAWLIPNLNNRRLFPTKASRDKAPYAEHRAYNMPLSRAWLLAILKAYREALE